MNTYGQSLLREDTDYGQSLLREDTDYGQSLLREDTDYGQSLLRADTTAVNHCCHTLPLHDCILDTMAATDYCKLFAQLTAPTDSAVILVCNNCTRQHCLT